MHTEQLQEFFTRQCGFLLCIVVLVIFPGKACKPIEKAVFETIFENIADVPSFEQAIAESMPDKKAIQNLELEVKTEEKVLKKANRELDKLIDLALSGTLSKETIKAREQELIQVKEKATERLTVSHDKLRSMPEIDKVKQDAEMIRRQLLERFSGKGHLQKMSFDEKRNLLHWLFDGKDQKGSPYSIYITKIGKRKDQKIDYFLYGRITGLRTLKGDDINYQEDEYIYKSSKVVNYLMTII